MAKAQRIDWLDSIRGIAAFLVMVIHYFHIGLMGLLPILFNNPAYVPNPAQHDTLRDTLNFFQQNHVDISVYNQITNYILGYWDIGKIGVVLFFFISGVVIPFSLFKKSDKPIQHFVLSRFFRLYPIYWVALTLVLLFEVKTPYSLPAILLNYSMFQKFVGFPDINGVAWTLQIELIFYFLCAAMFHFNLLKPKACNLCTIGFFWLVAIGFAALKMIVGIKAPIALPLGLSVMFMGFLWRKWLFQEENIGLGTIIGMFSIYALIIPVVSFMGYTENAWTYINTYYIAAVLLIAFTTAFKMHQASLRFLGKISYSVYLLHAMVGALLIPVIMQWIGKPLLTYPALLLVPILAAMTVALLLSSATYLWIEEPCVSLGRKLAKRWLDAPALPEGTPRSQEA